MVDVAADAPEDPRESLRMVLSMGVIGLVSGLLIVATYQLTFERIKKNRAEALQRAVFEAVPGAEKVVAFAPGGEGVLIPVAQDAEAPYKYYAGYGSEGELIGVAVEARGQGFQDIIGIIYGYSPSRQAIIGMKVLQSKETPGLGDKIEKDPAFRANFEDMDVSLSPDGASLLHPIMLVKPGKKDQRWQVEGITGATISAKAITKIMKESTAKAVVELMKNRAVLEQGEAP